MDVGWENRFLSCPSFPFPDRPWLTLCSNCSANHACSFRPCSLRALPSLLLSSFFLSSFPPFLLTSQLFLPLVSVAFSTPHPSFFTLFSITLHLAFIHSTIQLGAMETTDNTTHHPAQAEGQAQPQILPTPTANHNHQTTNNTPIPSKPPHTNTNSNMSLLSPELVSAFRVCIRSYGVGYVFATAPKLIKTLLGFIMNPRKVTPKGQNPVVALVKTLLTIIKDGTSSKRDGMSMLLMITLGGYKLLEVFLTRGIKKAALAQHVQHQQHLKQQQQQMADKEGSTSSSSSSSSLADDDQSTSSLKNLTMKDVDKVNLAEDMQQRITMLASFLSSAAAVVFMHRKRPNHATIDYSLFAVVRALDVFGHVAVKKQWGPRWLGSYGAVAVFVLACTEIMFSWLYEPQRLPG